MITTVYVSASSVLLDEQRLSALLTQARKNNERRNITGILLYSDGNFMQALEGDADRVDPLLQKIARDPRHLQMRVLYRADIASRQFADWSMGLRSLRDLLPEDRETCMTLMQSDFATDHSGAGAAVARLLERFRISMA